MPRGKDVKVWNEDLAKALKARQEVCERTASRIQYTWLEGYNAIVAVRKDIYCFSNGRVANLPSNLKKTVLNLCMDIIRGNKNLYPDGYSQNVGSGDQYEKNWDNDPYLKTLKSRSGPYAIMRAFDVAGLDMLSKDQIVRHGQQFCDTQMEANYMAGRSHGAWSSNATLIHHGLLVKNGNTRYVEGRGFRSERNTYTLTRDGQKFIDAMKRKFPKDFVGNNGKREAAASVKHIPITSREQFGYPLGRRGGGSAGVASPTAVSRRAGRLGSQDEQDLRSWVAVSSVGDKKVFSVGKDRRQNLHNTCTALEHEIPGLTLDHQSRGEARRRTLHIGILRKGGNATSSSMVRAPTKRVASDTFENSPLPSKYARQLSASVRAADAAELRISKLREAKQEEDDMERALKASLRSEKLEGVPLLPSSFDEEEGLHEAIRQSLTESERKPAAQSASGLQKRVISLPPRARPFDATRDVDLIGNRKPPARRETAEGPLVDLLSEDKSHQSAASSNKVHSLEVVCLDDSLEQEVIEIDESQDNAVESQSSVIVLDDFKSPRNPANHQLTVLIDSRERNRNITPRELRIELTRILRCGALQGVWPSKMPACLVEEASLPLGDFVFDIGVGAVDRTRLSVVIERKRVGDLVQRSVGGDHWHQFLRMRDSAQHAVFLVEHDTRSASRFTAYGAQNVDGWSPFGTLIENEQAVFLFFGRALLSSRSTKFIQTRDELASLRSVGAFGLMAALSPDQSKEVDQSVRDGPSALKDKLITGGVPWQLVRHVSKLFHSLKYAQACYRECADDQCRSRLLVPFLSETTCGGMRSTKDAWSDAVFRALVSDLSSESSFKLQFEDKKHLIRDHGKFLGSLHSGVSLQEALGCAQAEPVLPSMGNSTRRVLIDLQEDYAPLFPQPVGDDCFFEIRTMIDNPLCIRVNTVIMQTKDDRFTSNRLFVHMLSAKTLVASVERSMPAIGGDYIGATKNIATSLNDDSHHKSMKEGRDRRVLLLCGLAPALDAVAKQSGYRTEMRAMIDLVLAQLTLCHDIVVIQAVRISGDNEMILQQLALACFHYHLLPNKGKT